MSTLTEPNLDCVSGTLHKLHAQIMNVPKIKKKKHSVVCHKMRSKLISSTLHVQPSCVGQC